MEKPSRWNITLACCAVPGRNILRLFVVLLLLLVSNYRDSLLTNRSEKGGSQDEMTSLINFLGREPKTDAFYEELGLNKGVQSGATGH